MPKTETIAFIPEGLALVDERKPELGWRSVPRRCRDCDGLTVTTHSDGSQSCGYCAVERYRSYHRR
jgi:hypothetical protein